MSGKEERRIKATFPIFLSSLSTTRIQLSALGIFLFDSSLILLIFLKQIINFTMQAIKDNLDPIQELPNEMFSSILSFLPPSSIAHSSAASRLWRSTILSNPTLHQEIDLTSMLANLPILYHYSRLSSLALNQVVKLSLNLTPFYNEFSQNLEQEDRSFSGLDVLLSMIQNSKETMKELNNQHHPQRT